MRKQRKGRGMTSKVKQDVETEKNEAGKNRKRVRHVTNKLEESREEREKKVG